MNTPKTNRGVWNRVALIVTLIVMSSAMNGCGVVRGALRGVGARVLGNLGKGRIFNGPVARALRGSVNWNGAPRGGNPGGGATAAGTERGTNSGRISPAEGRDTPRPENVQTEGNPSTPPTETSGSRFLRERLAGRAA